MPKLTTSDLVNSISQLGTVKAYKYYSGSTFIQIKEITKPEGPIRFLRWGNKASVSTAAPGGISTNQLAIVASVFSGKPNYPIHFDRLFSAGGNSRAALETLLALTPNFFICYPQRTNPYTGQTDASLKHIMWSPDEKHALGEIKTKEYKQVISEVEIGVDFGDIQIPAVDGRELETIQSQRIHVQMQVALIEIGNTLNFDTWIAKPDQSIRIGDLTLGKMPGVINSLEQVPMLYTSDSKDAARNIDCIWFSKDRKFMPAVIEVENSTGVTSGLTRMLKFRETMPSLQTKFTIVASNDLRNKVVSESNSRIFRDLNARFMPYSTVRELYGLIRRYSLRNVVERDFIVPFMEIIVE